MKYVKSIIFLFLICIALDYLNVISFRHFFEIEYTTFLTTLLPLLLILLVVNSLAAIRWVLIFNRFTGVSTNILSGMSMTFKSGLFSYFLPGQLGSEIGRVFLVIKENSKSQINYALTSAIIDRAISLISIFSTLFLFILISFNYKSRIYYFAFFLFGIFILYLIAHFGQNFLRISLISLRKFRHIEYLGNILKMIKTYAIENPKFCIVLLVYSMFLNLLVVVVLYFIVTVMIIPIKFSDVAIMSLISNISSIIPITPGGVGVSEIVFERTGNFMNNNYTSNLASGYLTFRFLNIISYLLGIVLVLLYKRINRIFSK